MQLNIYVPKNKERLLQQIERLAQNQHRSKNEIVLKALETYLTQHRDDEFEFGVFDLGSSRSIERGALYEERLDRKAAPS